MIDQPGAGDAVERRFPDLSVILRGADVHARVAGILPEPGGQADPQIPIGAFPDELIERAAHRFLAFGEVLVVTDDLAERDTVSGFGCAVASCRNFIRRIETALTELRDQLQHRNRAEQKRFRRPPG